MWGATPGSARASRAGEGALAYANFCGAFDTEEVRRRAGRRPAREGARSPSLMTAGPHKQWFPPSAVVYVPIDGGIEAVFEIGERFPF